MTQPRWSDPLVEEVLPGVWRAPVPLPADGLRAVNVYVLADSEGVALVDAGWDGPQARAAVEAGLAAAGAGVGDVHRLLVTHSHYDHIGQASALGRDGAARYWLGEGEQPALHTMRTDPVASRRRRLDALEAHGAVELAAAGRASDGLLTGPVDWDPPERWLVDGEQVALRDGGALRTLATPGHTRGHVCFVDDTRRVLFSGDHVLPHITPSIGLEPETNPLALVDFLGSLAVVRPLDVDMVLPAHGPVFSDLAGRVDELVAHHDVRLGQCLGALSVGGSTAHTVATRLPWTRRQTDFADLDRFNQGLAVWETVAHLELLVGRNQVHRTTAEGTISYTPLAVG